MIRYIAGDGTGYYDCDGSADQGVINEALSWANSNPGNQVHLKGPYTYDLTGPLHIGSSTIFSGDSTAKLRLNDSCLWASGVPTIGQIGGGGTATHDVEICGFEVDMNQAHLYHSGTDRIHGKGYYNTIRIRGSATNPALNINIHGLKLHDSLGDGPRLEYAKNIKVHDCTMYNLQHASVFCIDCEDIVINNNNIQQITCAAVRLDNCRDADIYKNTIKDWVGASYAPKGGAYGVQIGNEPSKYGHTSLTNNINIYNNNIESGACGIELEDYLTTAGITAQNVHIHNNILNNCGWTNWANYFSGISFYSWGNGVTIEYNTIRGSYRAGILVASAITSGVSANVNNNNIINTVRANGSGGFGIWNKIPSSFSVISSSNYLNNNISGDFSGVSPVSQRYSYIDNAVPVEPPVEPPVVDPGGDDEPTPEPPEEEPETGIIEGSQGVMLPTNDGHYVFQKLRDPTPGDQVLLFPMPGGDYCLLKLSNVATGTKTTIVPDGKGNYYAVE